MKNAIMQVTYFLIGSMVNLLFYWHIILYWEKLASYEKFSHSLFWKPKLSGRFQRFSTIDGSIKMLKYIWISVKANKGKSFLRIYTGIYRRSLSQCFENAVLGRLDIMHCKPEACLEYFHIEGFWLCCGYVFCNVERVEVFWAELYYKTSDLSCQFLLALNFSAIKPEIKG